MLISKKTKTLGRIGFLLNKEIKVIPPSNGQIQSSNKSNQDDTLEPIDEGESLNICSSSSLESEDIIYTSKSASGSPTKISPSS